METKNLPLNFLSTSNSCYRFRRHYSAALGYSYRDGEWVSALPSAAASPRSLMTAESDAMHGVLVHRADALDGASMQPLFYPKPPWMGFRNSARVGTSI